MRPINRVATAFTILVHRPSAAAFAWSNKTSIWNQQAHRVSNIMSSSSSSDTVESDRFIFYKYDSTESTQDEARRLVKEMDGSSASNKCLAVSAKEQTKGRGTSGRQWVGLSGNVFLTVAIPYDKVPVIITLLPLKVGTIVAKTASKLLQECHASSKVTVKWPNDVLVDQRKIAGVLIESETTLLHETWLLVGIGINLVHAPTIPTQGPNRGRPSTSIQENCRTKDSTQQQEEQGESTLVAAQVASELIDWIHDSQTEPKQEASNNVLAEWKQWTQFGTQQVLRDAVENEMVVPIGIELDGQLRVRGEDGRERLLVAEYLL